MRSNRLRNPLEPGLPVAPLEVPAWPPAVDERTEWGEVRISRGYGQPAGVVRVRWVLLWGKRVQINAASEVWCPSCLSFRTTEQLGHPHNSCPVGLPARSGVIVRVEDTTVDDGPRLDSAWDLIMRGQW